MLDLLEGVEGDADGLDVVRGDALRLHGGAVGVVDGVGDIAASGAVNALSLVVEVRGHAGTEASEFTEVHRVATLNLFDNYILQVLEAGLHVDRGEGTLFDDALDDVIKSDGSNRSKGGIPLLNPSLTIKIFLVNFIVLL